MAKKNTRSAPISGAVLLLLVLAPIPARADSGTKAHQDQCFLVSNVNGFSAPNNHTVLVRVGVNEVFRLDLMTDCGDLTFRQHLTFERQPADPWICSPIDATIINREDGISQRCPVTGIHKLTPQEIATVPKKDLP